MATEEPPKCYVCGSPDTVGREPIFVPQDDLWRWTTIVADERIALCGGCSFKALAYMAKVPPSCRQCDPSLGVYIVRAVRDLRALALSDEARIPEIPPLRKPARP
jgi:hypothetical protein